MVWLPRAYSFWQNPRTWQMDTYTQTDTAWRHGRAYAWRRAAKILNVSRLKRSRKFQVPTTGKPCILLLLLVMALFSCRVNDTLRQWNFNVFRIMGEQARLKYAIICYYNYDGVERSPADPGWTGSCRCGQTSDSSLTVNQIEDCCCRSATFMYV